MELSEILVSGIGAVSPAGWSVNSFRDALAKGEPLPTKSIARPGWTNPLRVRPTAPTSPKPDFLGHPRLRRTSPITQFAVAAALEAIGPEVEFVRAGGLRLGVVLCVMAGCVSYSRRFYDETLRDPATASPLVFPETVFNAPASHLAAYLGQVALSYTFVGDPGMFLIGLATGADWLLQDRVDGCLVIGAEEADWIVADAFRRFERRAILSDGAGAVYLKKDRPSGPAVQMERVTDAWSFGSSRSRSAAAAGMRAQLPLSHPSHLLVEGTQSLSKFDAPECAAWSDWTGNRIAIKDILGEGLAAASGWQCVAAIDALRQQRFQAASVSVVGCNQQAIGAHFVRVD